jgi:hypothetical protein
MSLQLEQVGEKEIISRQQSTFWLLVAKIPLLVSFSVKEALP